MYLFLFEMFLFFFQWVYQNCCDLEILYVDALMVLISFQTVSNTQRKSKRRITVDNPVRSRVLQSTTQELKHVMVETLQSSTPELKGVAVKIPSYQEHDVTVNSLGLDFHAGKGNSIFVSRPAIVSKNSGSFSLQHLGQSPFTFSLDHLRSE